MNILYLLLVKCCLSFLTKDDLENVHCWVACAETSGPDLTSRLSSMFNSFFARRRETGKKEMKWPSNQIRCKDKSVQSTSVS